MCECVVGLQLVISFGIVANPKPLCAELFPSAAPQQIVCWSIGFISLVRW
jgi:hypothetical protein